SPNRAHRKRRSQISFKRRSSASRTASCDLGLLPDSAGITTLASQTETALRLTSPPHTSPRKQGGSSIFKDILRFPGQTRER
ncbi:MAG: hypothetical protein Q8P67_03630, partial [archaeon]|nr:hypothetical protein [archaeon]